MNKIQPNQDESTAGAKISSETPADSNGGHFRGQILARLMGCNYAECYCGAGPRCPGQWRID